MWRRTGLVRPWNPPEADYDRAVSGPASAVLGVVDIPTDEVIASVMVGHDGHRGWVYYLAVDPTCEGRGLGRTLMTAAEEWVRVRGIRKLELMVRTDNTDVKAFYGRLGYEQADVVVLARWLTEGDAV